MYDIVFKDALIMDGFTSFEGDLAVSGDRIAAVGHGLSGHREIASEGKWLLPGGIDVHTHMSLSFARAISADTFGSGTTAAAFGGVTTIIDFTDQRDEEGLKEGFERRMKLAQDSVIDYSFHACIRKLNVKVEEQLEWAAETGLSSLKSFTAYGRSGSMLRDGEIMRAFELCRRYGLLPTVHSELGELIDFVADREVASGNRGMDCLAKSRTVFSEVEAVRRVSEIARSVGASVYIVHVSSGDTLDEIVLQRAKGSAVFAETCPQYLYLNNDRFVEKDGHLFSSCPPIREARQSEKIWGRIADGTVNVVGTDHCPFTLADKNNWNGDISKLPMGMGGVETLVPLSLNGSEQGRAPLDRIIRALTFTPAVLFGIYPRKGSLIPGTDADLVLYDPAVDYTISARNLHSATDYTPYEGLRIKGRPVMTVSRGEVIVENGCFKGAKGQGKFLSRKRFEHKDWLNVCHHPWRTFELNLK